MSATKVTTPEIVRVEWIDAAHTFGWQNGNDTVDDEPLPFCVSVGFVLSKTKVQIQLCQTYSSDNHAQTISIPAGMIKSITTLQKKTVRVCR